MAAPSTCHGTELREGGGGKKQPQRQLLVQVLTCQDSTKDLTKDPRSVTNPNSRLPGRRGRGFPGTAHRGFAITPSKVNKGSVGGSTLPKNEHPQRGEGKPPQGAEKHHKNVGIR